MEAMRSLSAKLLIPQEERYLPNSDDSDRRDNLSRRIARVQEIHPALKVERLQ